LDTPEKITKKGGLNKGDSHVPGRNLGNIDIPRDQNQAAERPDGPMMKRITKVLDRMDWSQVECRADMIKHIFEGERTMVCYFILSVGWALLIQAWRKSNIRHQDHPRHDSIHRPESREASISSQFRRILPTR
jgi:hypothetical protein